MNTFAAFSLLLAAQVSQATWQPVQFPTYHQGHWTSCGGEEQVLEHRVNGKLQWEFHMGPGIEFGLYDHEVDGEHSHRDPENLLGTPAIDTMTLLGGSTSWFVPTHHLWIEVVKAGVGSDTCDAFYIKIDHQTRIR